MVSKLSLASWLETHEVVVVGKASCPFCTKARQLLDGSGIPYCYVPITKVSRAELARFNGGMTTVPQVWRNGTLVGGYTELSHELHSGMWRAHAAITCDPDAAPF
jgi:glutaredoxin